MKRLYITPILFFFILILPIRNFIEAQLPQLQYSTYYKSNGTGQVLYDAKATVEGGFILTGVDSLYSIPQKQVLDKENGGWPIIIKADVSGNIIWSARSNAYRYKSAYTSVARTSSNEFVTAGYGAPFSQTFRDYIEDFYVVKYQNNGSVAWEKTFGGTSREFAQSIIQTADGGYAVAGYTNSNDGDVSGNHGTGTYDFWIVKLNSTGTLQWQKCFGGSEDDKAFAIQQTKDGGYIIAGVDSSANGNVTSYKGRKDGWVIKTDNNGNLQWQKSYGGTNNDVFKSVLQTSDGGYMLTGYTYSNDGDVSGNHGNADVWVVKIDGTGNIVWQKCLGGSNEEYGAGIDRTVDNAFLVAGHTLSNDGDVSGNNGGADAWLVKLDGGGNLIWQRTVGTSKNEFGLSAVAVAEKEFAIAGYGEPITLPFFDVSDGVLSKLGNFNTIKGTLFYDKNSNGIKDANEPYFSEATVKSEKTNFVRSDVPFNGFFRNDVDTGTYKTSVTFNSPYYTTAPLTYTSSFSSYFNNDSLNFAVQPIQGKHDLSIGLVAITPSRPGFTTQYKLMYKNQGTDTITNGTVQLVKSNKLTFVSSSPSYTSVSGDTLRWSYSNFKPQDTASITLKLTVATPPSANVGDKITSIASITPVISELTPLDDTSRLIQTLVGSYDPNDKTESHAGALTQQQLSNNEWLQYTIRFQNTGTDTAFNVYVRDTLSNKVDWNTLQMVSASHNYQLTINDNNKLLWSFNNIKLVDSTRNEPASHGYIVYRIKPASSLVAGDTVKNTASIYFDFNLPVTTNRESTIVQSIILPVNLTSFIADREGLSNHLQWNFIIQQSVTSFEIERSNDGIHYTSIGKVNASGNGAYTFTDYQPSKAVNYYRIKMIDKDGTYEYSAIRTINNTGSFEVSIYPNPVHNVLSLKIYSEKKDYLQLQLADVEGKTVFSQQLNAEAGSTIKTINTNSLKSGSYFIKVTSETKEQWLIKFVKL